MILPLSYTEIQSPNIQKIRDLRKTLLRYLWRHHSLWKHETYIGNCMKQRRMPGTVSWYVGSGYAEAAGKANSQSSELNNALNAGLVAISKKTDESFSYHAVAVVYKKMKNMDKAIEYIQKAGGLEGNRETSMHTYDRKRHLLYRRLLQKWMMD